MKQKDIEALSAKELKEKIQEEKQILLKMDVAHKISQAENPMKIRTTRKLIARLSTELTKKSKAASK
ncbi:MAG: 50S ribosomal protein L29 [Bacteroidetes bacterium]|nr:50S ribosomal protein L29 [Bacteroidota bacterium]